MSPSGPDDAKQDDAKQEVRERVWDALDRAKVVGFPGVHGRIPNFTGAADAARLLAGTDEWQRAATLKANPDMPQLPVRAAALEAGKAVFMAVPRLREPDPFLLLDPDRLDVRPRQAASIKGSSIHGVPTAVDAMEPLDLVVCGSVAVNAAGARIGKGGGYSDLELGLAIECGLVTDDTVIVTTVHPIQVVDDELPETSHDFRVDLIVTPDEVIRCPRVARPPGIVWADLDDDKIAAIPVLAARRPRS
ncbi:MAG: 5-formyltetrahydrofolate cyclo-ligase [Actinomycetota bacterium]|nr:5-formyltetrahydrofolate cyclo-ligase [Actinomycetota bacterium]